jgi:hypothetical protein
MRDGAIPRTIDCLCALLPWLLFVVISSMALAEEPGLFHVDLHASQNEVEIAQPLELTISATAPQGWTILPPPLLAKLIDLRVVNSSEESERIGSQVIWTRHLTIESYAPGRKTIGPIEVTFAPPQFGHDAISQPRTLATEAAVIRVRSALGLFETRNELRPIHDAVAVPWTWWQWGIATGCLVVIVGCGVMVVRRVNRFHDDGRLSRQSPLRDLERLKDAWLKGNTSDGETVAAASEIARRWLRCREGALTIHRTTEVWAARLQRRGAAACAPLVDVLRLADRVKFAGAEPTLDEVRESLAHVRQVIDAQRDRP